MEKIFDLEEVFFFFLLPENVTNRYLKIKWQAGETAGWVKALAIQTGELEISVQISKNHFKAGNGGVSLHNPSGKWEAKTGDSPETTGQKTWLMKQQEDPVLNKMKMGGLTSKGCPLTSVSSSPTQHIHNKQTACLDGPVSWRLGVCKDLDSSRHQNQEEA